MTAATMTPDAQKVLANLRDRGPATIADMGSLFARRPAEGGPRTVATREWSGALARAQLVLSELEEQPNRPRQNATGVAGSWCPTTRPISSPRPKR